MNQLKAQSVKRKVKARNSRILILSFSFSLSALSFTLLSFAQSISSIELINNAKLYDGKPVAYEGEAIGDVMRRGNYAWINVNDGANAIGIWTSASSAAGIAYTGSYKAWGDRIEVVGIFHRACPEHGGDLDIHAQAIRKINPGRIINEKLNLDKRNLVLVLLGALGALWILTLFKNK